MQVLVWAGAQTQDFAERRLGFLVLGRPPKMKVLDKAARLGNNFEALRLVRSYIITCANVAQHVAHDSQHSHGTRTKIQIQTANPTLSMVHGNIGEMLLHILHIMPNISFRTTGLKERTALPPSWLECCFLVH